MNSRINRALNARLARRKSDEGFTLIELLVVVIIIGILAAIAIPVYLGIQNNARDSAVKSDVANMKTAIVAFTVRTGALPVSGTSSLAADGYAGPSAATNFFTGASSLPSYSTVGTTGFCVIAKSVTATLFGASDTTGVVTATSCGSGVLVYPTP